MMKIYSRKGYLTIQLLERYKSNPYYYKVTLDRDLKKIYPNLTQTYWEDENGNQMDWGTMNKFVMMFSDGKMKVYENI